MSARLPLQSKVARPRFQIRGAVFGDDDDTDERIADERIVGIEDNKITEAAPKKKAEPLSIAPLPNVDWRALAKRKRELFMPARAQQPSIDEAKPEVLEQGVASFGLQVQQKKAEDDVVETKQETVVTEQIIVSNNEEPQQSLEQRAIEAIIKESKGEIEEENDRPVKVIPANETIAFRDDIQTRPDETTMEEYERLPVDEYGAALLRGLGWNEGEGIGRNRKNTPTPVATPVKQREALLGLGAKPEDIKKDSKTKSKDRREAYQYKDTGLFKKISKRKYEEEMNGSRSRSTSSSASSRRSRYDDEERSESRRRRYDDEERSESRRRRYDDEERSDSRRRRKDDEDRSESRRRRYDDDDDGGYSRERRHRRSRSRDSKKSKSYNK
ncbi:hypothetical protein RMATCC62417_14913 [Rhizopus microsporus]|nr:hypothetical protein RMATCC62417_14913 [Rhizopus microsporus]